MVQATPGKLSNIYMTQTPSVTMTAEPTTKNTSTVIIDGVSYPAYSVYTITAAAHRYIDDQSSYTILKNGSAITTGFFVECCGGRIVFATPNVSGDAITVTGKYLPYAKIDGGTNWEFSTDFDEADTICYGMLAEARTDTILKARATIGGLHVDGNLYATLGTRAIIVLHETGTYNTADSSGSRFEFYAMPTRQKITSKLKDVIRYTIDFASQDRAYRRT